ncbi:MAG: hypothetical protein AAB508_06920 [Patescibacteria group bacterium]
MVESPVGEPQVTFEKHATILNAGKVVTITPTEERNLAVSREQQLLEASAKNSDWKRPAGSYTTVPNPKNPDGPGIIVEVQEEEDFVGHPPFKSHQDDSNAD